MTSKQSISPNASHSLETIQWLRFIAAWVVVYQHFKNNYILAQYTYHFGGDDRLYSHIWTGAHAVQVFFVISGFLMCLQVRKQTLSAGRFFLKRLIRVTPAYWFWTFMMIVVLELVPGAFTEKWSVSHTIYSLLYITKQGPDGEYLPLLGQGWSLNIEMDCYLILAACIAILPRFRMIAAGVLLLTLPLIFPEAARYISSMTHKMAFGFVAGMAIGELYARFAAQVDRKRIALGVILLIIFISTPLQTITYLHGPLLVAAILCFEPWVARLKWKLPHYLGDISYSTYLVHYIVIRLCLYFLPVPSSIATELLLQVSMFSLTFVLSQLTYHFLEIPSKKVLTDRFLKRSTNK